ncbi:MAG TPA: SpoIIE family protein phosphatase [Thermoanaerobaculia bacterium]|nr:SpoIIE family protein phosphatase [Thermoanaerobaculia bacterium]
MKPPGSITLRAALLRGQLLILAILSGALLFATYLGTASAVGALTRSLIRDAVSLVEIELQLFFGPVRRALDATCSWHESGLLDPENHEALLQLVLPVMGDLSQVGGVVVVDQRVEHRLERQPGAGGPRLTAGGAWRVHRHPLGTADDASAAAGAHREAASVDPDWYAGASEKASAAASLEERLYWSRPYLSAEEGQLVMTGALGCRSPSDVVVAVDVLLEDLATFVRGISVSPNGGVSLMTDDFRLIAHPDRERFWQGDDARGWLLRNPGELQSPLIDDAVAAYAGLPSSEVGQPVLFFSSGEPWWVQLRQFSLASEGSLVVAVMIPTTDLLAERRRFRLAIGLVTLAVLLATIVWSMRFARRLSRPIEALMDAGERISRGELDAAIEVPSRLAEVRALAEAQEKMRSGLREAVKLERDLQLARQIQQGSLPQRLPAVRGYDLAAWSEPADETGGDTYDVIPLPSGSGSDERPAERAILLLADASGHGIAPALVVTQLRAMLRIAVRLGAELVTVVEQMNEQLAADLPRNRFITAWLAELDTQRHVLRWLAAGQGPLLHYRAAAGEVSTYRGTCLPIGIFPTLDADRFREQPLEPGDVFVALTDGFFEAEDPSGHELGVERLTEVLRRVHNASAESIVDSLRAAARDWTGDRPLADDCSALVLRRE